jgi:hypothetical protein
MEEKTKAVNDADELVKTATRERCKVFILIHLPPF